MSKGRLYEYAVIYHPKPKKDPCGNELEPVKSVLVTDVTRVLASGDKEVGMLAAKGIPNDYNEYLDDVEICIRPFV